MADKPHKGRIKNWKKRRISDGSQVITGEFLDHPYIRGLGHTSSIVKHDEATGEVETRNTRYTLDDDGDPSRVEGFPHKGDFMMFKACGGWPAQRERAEKVFKIGSMYEVEDCVVEPYDHTVKLVGVDGRWNGVMFERVLE